MTSALATFLKGQDEFGENVQFTFKGNDKHGTAIGGVCSLIAKLFFWLFFG
jgi:hypothetical protein